MTDNLSNVSGGVNLDANNATIGGDVVGRDEITVIPRDKNLVWPQ